MVHPYYSLVIRKRLLFGIALRVKTEVETGKCLKNMVRPERFELPTFWFVARRSIQLS